MPKTNDKTDVNSEMLRSLAERIGNCARKFSEIANSMDSKGIDSVPLALDTFKKVAMERLEAFSRTIEREFIRASDVTHKPNETDESLANVAENIDQYATNVGKQKPKAVQKPAIESKAVRKKRTSG